MGTLIDLTGVRFGRLVVSGFAFKNTQGSHWSCFCDCGAESVVRGSHLKSGATKSCGCLHAEIAAKVSTKHGMWHSPENNAWYSMKDRCYNEKHKHFKDYGGRGIAICDRWRYSFENFFKDMGPRPSAKHSIDRIDNDGNYESGNCKWATQTEQTNNTRRNLFLVFDGHRLTSAQWAARLGIKPSTLRNRVNYRGWSVEKALTTEVKR